MELHLIIPCKYSGGVIGKNGSTVAKIRADSGARVKVWDSIGCPDGALPVDGHNGNNSNSNDSKNGDTNESRSSSPQGGGSTWERFVDISGDLEQVEKAVQAMCDAIEQSPCHTKGRAMCIKLSVDPAQIGAVIGNKGSHIQKVRQFTGVNVKIHEPNEMPMYAPCRVVAFVGESDKIAAAVQMCAFAIYNMAPAALVHMRSRSHSLTRSVESGYRRYQQPDDYPPQPAHHHYPPHGHMHYPSNGPPSVVSSGKPPPPRGGGYHHGRHYHHDPYYYGDEGITSLADRSTAAPASSLPPHQYYLPYQRSIVEDGYMPRQPRTGRQISVDSGDRQIAGGGFPTSKGGGKGKGRPKGGKGAKGDARANSHAFDANGEEAAPVPVPDDVTTTTIHLDAKTIGSVIGKKGTQIAFVRMTSGAHINIADARESTGLTREVSITGTTEQVFMAVSMMANICKSANVANAAASKEYHAAIKDSFN